MQVFDLAAHYPETLPVLPETTAIWNYRFHGDAPGPFDDPGIRGGTCSEVYIWTTRVRLVGHGFKVAARARATIDIRSRSAVLTVAFNNSFPPPLVRFRELHHTASRTISLTAGSLFLVAVQLSGGHWHRAELTPTPTQLPSGLDEGRKIRLRPVAVFLQSGWIHLFGVSR